MEKLRSGTERRPSGARFGPQLARALGETKLPCKRLYDGHTAASFAQHWWDNQ